MPDSPLISFIIPSYQQAPLLKKCLDSIAAQGLHRKQYEVLVYDGGSEDDSVTVLQEHPLKPTWVSRPDEGQAHAVNQGLRQARGSVLAWINSDDYYLPDAITKVLEFFQEHPEQEILYGKADYVDRAGKLLEPYPTEPWNFYRLAEICYLCQPAVFFRPSIVRKHGYLDESLHCALDYEYWMRIGKLQPFYYLTEKLACSRLYPEAKSLRYKIQAEKEALLITQRHTGIWSSRWKEAWVNYKTKEWMNRLNSHGEQSRTRLTDFFRGYLDTKLKQEGSL